MPPPLAEWFDLGWWSPGLQSLPIRRQFPLVDLGPRFHKPLLSSLHCATDQLDWLNSEHS